MIFLDKTYQFHNAAPQTVLDKYNLIRQNY